MGNGASPLPCALLFPSRQYLSVRSDLSMQDFNNVAMISSSSTNALLLSYPHAASFVLSLYTQCICSASALHLGEGRRETEMGRISSINLLHLLDLFQSSQIRSKIPASMSSILPLSENTPHEGSQCFDLQSIVIIPQTDPAGTVCGSPQE